MKMYSKYQDYVIKDGEMIGEFEKMYQDFDDPWEQTTRELNALEKTIGIELIKNYGHKRPLEYGCGFGDYTNRIYKTIGCAGGVDISATAIKKARVKYPNIDFYVGDLLSEDVLVEFNPDCICMIEISWYVLDKLDKFKNILAATESGKGFLHTLMTYAPGEQQYGADYFTNIDEIKKYWSDVIDIKEWGVSSKITYNGGHRTFIYGTVK